MRSILYKSGYKCALQALLATYILVIPLTITPSLVLNFTIFHFASHVSISMLLVLSSERPGLKAKTTQMRAKLLL